MWPEYVTNRFISLPNNPRERDYHGPYNKLLCSVFPIDSNFTVSPQSYPIYTSRDTVDFIVEYTIILNDNIPVFILEIKEPSALMFASSRHQADRQIRSRIKDLYPLCKLPILYAASAFGTTVSIYSKSGNMILPEYIPGDPESETDTAPIVNWDIDILTDDGYVKMMEIFNYIKDQSAKVT